MISEATSAELSSSLNNDNLVWLSLAIDNLTNFDDALKIETSLKYAIQHGHIGTTNTSTYLYATTVHVVDLIDKEIQILKRLDASDSALRKHSEELQNLKNRILVYLKIFTGEEI